MLRLKRIFPRIDKQRSGALTFDSAPDVSADLAWALSRWPMRISDEDLRFLLTQELQYKKRQESVGQLLRGDNARLPHDYEPSRPPRDYQLLPAEMAMTTGGLLLADELGLGKAQPLSARVLTPDGFRPIGEIRVGDRVFAGDGTPTRVRATFPQGTRPIFRVGFSDGTETRCDEEHLWEVTRKGRQRSEVHTLRHIQNWKPNRPNAIKQRWFTPMVKPPDLDRGGARPIHPYILGALLGDGCFRTKRIDLGSEDYQEMAGIIRPLLAPGLKLTVYPPTPRSDGQTNTGAIHFAKDVADGKSNPIKDAVKDLGLYGHLSLNKFIPDSYLWASADDRLALLQGLMDTDGGCGCGEKRGHGRSSSEFYTSSTGLRDGMVWLTRSLGGTASVGTKWIAGRERYTVTIRLASGMNPFRLRRKAERMGEAGHWYWEPKREIISIEPDGREEAVCISVEHPSQLYVTDDFIVTHNTMSGMMLLRFARLLPAVVVVPTHLPDHWLRELAKTLPLLRTHVARTGNPFKGADAKGMMKNPDVVIISYHKLKGWSSYLKGLARAVIFEEAQQLRNSTSDIYTACGELADAVDVVMGLTATPIYNYASEIYNVMAVLSPDALGSREEFAREWSGADSWNDKNGVAEPKALGTYLRNGGLMIRRTRAEVGRELPEIVRITHSVDCDEAELDKILEEGGTFALAETILHSENKQDVFEASGQIDWQVRRATGVAKAPYVSAFSEMLLESEQKLMIFVWHRDVYEVLMERLAAYHPVMFSGSESPRQKDMARARFIGGDDWEKYKPVAERAARERNLTYQGIARALEESRVFLMSMRSGSGLDGMQHVCNTGVFAELDWSPGIHDQCEGRYHRDGQQEPSVSYFLTSSVGSDPAVADVLNLKESGSRPVVDPDAATLVEAVDVRNRMKLLARSILEKRKARA